MARPKLATNNLPTASVALFSVRVKKELSLQPQKKAMKKSAVAALLCLIIAGAKAQVNPIEPDWSGNVYKPGGIYPGFYVSNANDTVYGYFMHDDKKSNQKKCRFYVNELDRKPTSEFKPEDIKSYKVGDKLYRTLNYSGGLLNKPLRFLLVTRDGGITEFVFYSEDGEKTPEAVFHKPKDPAHSDPITMSYFGLSFAKKLSDYISDYPALAGKVSGKEKGYGLLNLYAIIDEYNQWFATKKK